MRPGTETVRSTLQHRHLSFVASRVALIVAVGSVLLLATGSIPGAAVGGAVFGLYLFFAYDLVYHQVSQRWRLGTAGEFTLRVVVFLVGVGLIPFAFVAAGLTTPGLETLTGWLQVPVGAALIAGGALVVAEGLGAIRQRITLDRATPYVGADPQEGLVEVEGEARPFEDEADEDPRVVTDGGRPVDETGTVGGFDGTPFEPMNDVEGNDVETDDRDDPSPFDPDVPLFGGEGDDTSDADETAPAAVSGGPDSRSVSTADGAEATDLDVESDTVPELDEGFRAKVEAVEGNPIAADGETGDVVATRADRDPGAWRTAVVNWLADGFENEHGLDLRHDPEALRRLCSVADRVRNHLAERTETEILLPFIAEVGGRTVHLRRRLVAIDPDGSPRPHPPFGSEDPVEPPAEPAPEPSSGADEITPTPAPSSTSEDPAPAPEPTASTDDDTRTPETAANASDGDDSQLDPAVVNAEGTIEDPQSEFQQMQQVYDRADLEEIDRELDAVEFQGHDQSEEVGFDDLLSGDESEEGTTTTADAGTTTTADAGTITTADTGTTTTADAGSGGTTTEPIDEFLAGTVESVESVETGTASVESVETGTAIDAGVGGSETDPGFEEAPVEADPVGTVERDPEPVDRDTTETPDETTEDEEDAWFSEEVVEAPHTERDAVAYRYRRRRKVGLPGPVRRLPFPDREAVNARFPDEVRLGERLPDLPLARRVPDSVPGPAIPDLVESNSGEAGARSLADAEEDGVEFRVDTFGNGVRIDPEDATLVASPDAAGTDGPGLWYETAIEPGDQVSVVGAPAEDEEGTTDLRVTDPGRGQFVVGKGDFDETEAALTRGGLGRLAVGTPMLAAGVWTTASALPVGPAALGVSLAAAVGGGYAVRNRTALARKGSAAGDAVRDTEAPTLDRVRTVPWNALGRVCDRVCPVVKQKRSN